LLVGEVGCGQPFERHPELRAFGETLPERTGCLPQEELRLDGQLPGDHSAVRELEAAGDAVVA